METRTNWGIVVFAGVCAVALIGLASSRAYFDTPKLNNVIVAESEPVTPTGTHLEGWRSALEAIALTTATSTSLADYRAPEEFGASEALSHEFAMTYFQLKKDGKLGTATEDEALKALIQRNATKILTTDTYTLASLNTSSTVTLEQYADTLGNAIQKASVVKEYELVTFGRTVGQKNIKGTPELRASAGIYRSIESDLVRAPVPDSIAAAHLAFVKSIAFIAQSTELMAEWTGDPVEGMAFIDAFVRADRGNQTALSSLFTAIINAGKKV